MADHRCDSVGVGKRVDPLLCTVLAELAPGDRVVLDAEWSGHVAQHQTDQNVEACLEARGLVAVEQEQDVVFVAELHPVEEDSVKRILPVQRKGDVVVPHDLEQAFSGMKLPEQGEQVGPSRFHLTEGKTKQLLYVSVQYQGVVLEEVMLPQYGHEQIRVLQKIIPPAPVAHMEVAEDNQPLAAAQFGL